MQKGTASACESGPKLLTTTIFNVAKPRAHGGYLAKVPEWLFFLCIGLAWFSVESQIPTGRPPFQRRRDVRWDWYVC